MTRRFFAILLAIVAISACSRSGGSVAVSSNELRIAIPIDPTQLNPILTQNQVESFVDGLIFDELVTLDNHGNEVPDLAAEVPTLANGGISKNGLTITYHLRRDVRWQDGAPFTSRDVRFTWQAIMNPANNAVSRRGFDQVASVSTPDPYTVVFHMKKLFAPAIEALFGESDSPYRVLPAHLLAQYPNLNQVPFDAAPVGTGPYRFARWERGDRIVLDANPDYFRGTPHIKQLTIKIITDANTTETELRAHAVDLAVEVTAANFHSMESDPQLLGQLVNAPAYVAILFNTGRAPLDDVRVRRAIALAIDSRAIVRDTTYGTGSIGNADLTPFSWAYDKALKPTPFDPAQARALLDAAGWRVGPSGMRTKNGVPLSLQLVYGQGSTSARNIVVEVQQMLRQVGVAVQLKSYAYATLYAAAQSGGILNGGKFDMTLYAWISGGDPDNSSQWICSMIPPKGNNVSRYCSSQMDAAQRLALSTFDRTVRKRAYGHIETLLLQDAPAAFLFDEPMRYVRIPQLQNFEPNGISEGWNAQDWRL